MTCLSVNRGPAMDSSISELDLDCLRAIVVKKHDPTDDSQLTLKVHDIVAWLLRVQAVASQGPCEQGRLLSELCFVLEQQECVSEICLVMDLG